MRKYYNTVYSTPQAFTPPARLFKSFSMDGKNVLDFWIDTRYNEQALRDGRLAQLVAHPLDVREVTSSSLVSSTKRDSHPKGWLFCFAENTSRTCDLNLSAHCARIGSGCRTRSGLRPQVRVLYRPPKSPHRKMWRFFSLLSSVSSLCVVTQPTRYKISARQADFRFVCAGSVQILPLWFLRLFTRSKLCFILLCKPFL